MRFQRSYPHLIALALFAVIAQAANGRLRIYSVDGFGQPVSAEIQVLTKDGKQVQRSSGESAEFELPRADYKVSVQQPNAAAAVRDIPLRSSEVKLSIASPAAAAPSDSAATVSVWLRWSRECAGTQMLLRLEGVYWGRPMAQRANREGGATFESLEPGTYRLTITDSIGKRAIKEFRVNQKTVELAIDTTPDCQIR